MARNLPLAALLLGAVTAFASPDGAQLAQSLGINPATRATLQWERIFTQEKRLERMGITRLSDAEKEALKAYLIKHAADSDQPAAAGL